MELEKTDRFIVDYTDYSYLLYKLPGKAKGGQGWIGGSGHCPGDGIEWGGTGLTGLPFNPYCSLDAIVLIDHTCELNGIFGIKLRNSAKPTRHRHRHDAT